MEQEWGRMQFVKISMHEIFAFQDRLDAVKDNPEKVWDIVDSFFWEAENQLELDPDFIKELQELSLEEDFVPLHNLDDLDDLFKDECKEDYNPSHIEVLKSYKEYLKNKQDIPFTPRHNF